MPNVNLKLTIEIIQERVRSRENDCRYMNNAVGKFELPTLQMIDFVFPLCKHGCICSNI